MNASIPAVSPDVLASAARPERLPLPKGSFGLPVLGESLAFLRSTWRFVEDRRRKYGNVFRTHLFGSKSVYLLGPEANQWVFSGEGKYVQSDWPYTVRQLLGARCLLLLSGAEHLERRRLLAPYFSYATLGSRLPAIEAIIRRHFERWAEQGGVLTLWTAVRELAFELAVKIVFGEDEINLAFMMERFQTWSAGLFTAFPVDLPFTPFGRALEAREQMLAYIEEKVAARQERGEQPAVDVLGALMSARDEEGRPLSRQDICEEIQLLLYAGHETTVTAMCNLMYQLTQHPDVLRRGREQLDAAPAGPLTLEKLKSIPFLYQAISEGLRCMPPVGGVTRRATQDLVYQGYRIPKGWMVNVCMKDTHSGPSWVEPERFDPSRFSPEKRQQPGAYAPFGGGARTCLGQHQALVQMSVMLALLLRGYEWEPEPNQDLTYQTLPFPRPKSGIRVRFRRRAQLGA